MPWMAHLKKSFQHVPFSGKEEQQIWQDSSQWNYFYLTTVDVDTNTSKIV